MVTRTQFLLCPLCHQRKQRELNSRVKNSGLVRVRTYKCGNCGKTFISREEVSVPKNRTSFILDIIQKLGKTREIEAWKKHLQREKEKSIH